MLRKLKYPEGEKGRLILFAGICGALLIAAMLLPLAFRRTPDAPQSADFTAEDRAALFVTYWYDGAEGQTVEKMDEPGERLGAFCTARMTEIVSRCLTDRGLGDTTPTGSEYASVTGERGTVRLCRMWLQARGDWQNWLDVCFDADSGDVYYLYVSRECLTNLNLYTGAEHPEGREIAEGLAGEFGGALRYYLADGSGGGTAILSVDGSTLCYEIGCVAYDALIDVRINCV